MTTLLNILVVLGTIIAIVAIVRVSKKYQVSWWTRWTMKYMRSSPTKKKAIRKGMYYSYLIIVIWMVLVAARLSLSK